MSHDLLDDLLADVPRHVSADPVAAWHAGNRRRVRTYTVEGLAVAAAAALVGLGLVQLHHCTPVQPVGPSKTVVGHPRSVPRARSSTPRFLTAPVRWRGCWRPTTGTGTPSTRTAAPGRS
jgi:hypothetical protein